ncbi:MAG: Hsp20/alpha crystallin family protein [Saprospiraceae bacterium]|nr:Hsp20/alpha crystallin family protein [Saprospiraceae bacterium]
MINPIFTSNKITTIIDNILNSSLSDIIGTDFVSDSPSVNITENEKNHNIILAAPGLDKLDFVIKVENDQLLVSTNKELVANKKENIFLRREFSYSSFKRGFHLPETIDRENISAAYKDGILNITIAKKNVQKEYKDRKIDIS